MIRVNDRVPAGFKRQTGSALIVPEEHARQREVWTKDEARLLERATKLLESRGIALHLRCPHDGCTAPLERLRAPDGGLILRCDHKERHLSRSI